MKMPPITKVPAEFRAEAAEFSQSDDIFFRAAALYAAHVLAPPMLARRLRARGDDRASARDFHCTCPTASDTDRPRCGGIFADCRFEEYANGSKPPEDSPSQILIVEKIVDIAHLYKNAPAPVRAAMLAYMQCATDKQLKRVEKGRRPGKRLPEAQDEDE